MPQLQLLEMALATRGEAPLLFFFLGKQDFILYCTFLSSLKKPKEISIYEG